MFRHERHEATDLYFNSNMLEQNFENNKIVVPVDFEFLYCMLLLYIYYTLLYIGFISLPSDSVSVLISIGEYVGSVINIERKEGNDSLKLNLLVCVKNVIYIKECDWRKLSFWKWIDINIVPRVSIVIV